MKRQSLTLTLALSTVTLASTIFHSNPSHAKANTFFCGQSKGAPATMAKTAKGNVSVIRWTSDYFNDSGYTPQKRCEMVSERFETFRQLDALTYLTTGQINNQIVVCAAREEKSDCARDLPGEGLLFTLKPGVDPGKTLQQLLQVRVGASGPLNESKKRIYININQLIHSKPIEKTTSRESIVRPTKKSPMVNPQKYSPHERIF